MNPSTCTCSLETGDPAESRPQPLQIPMRILCAMNREDDFPSAAMTFCNELASSFSCRRVSLGFLQRTYIRLTTINGAEHVIRKMQLVRTLESAMEECADQDTEICFPAIDPDPGVITRATETLAQQAGPVCILSLPLRRADQVRGAVLFQRNPDHPFTPEEVEHLRLICELCFPRLMTLYEQQRQWFSILTRTCRQIFAQPRTSRYAEIKMGLAAGVLLLLFLIFGKGTFKAQAPFTLEAVTQQVVPAPFDGFLKQVDVEVGDSVQAGRTLLGALDTEELRLELAEAQAQRTGHLKKAAAAMRDGQTAQAQIAQAEAEKTEAHIQLLEHSLAQAELVAPISGTVVRGDLKRVIGAPVKIGEVLFEITPLESLRAQLQVPEDQITEIRVGQKGTLAAFSYPSEHILFEVERIYPMAEVIGQRNVFKVQVKLLQTHPWMRPGMEGVAKVHTRKRSYLAIWTRKATNWLRMKLWI